MFCCRQSSYGRDNALAFAVPPRRPEHLTSMSDKALGTNPVYRQAPQHPARDLTRQASHHVQPGAPPPGFQDQWRLRQRDISAGHNQPGEAYELGQHNVPASRVELEAAGIQKPAKSKYPASSAQHSASAAVPAKVNTSAVPFQISKEFHSFAPFCRLLTTGPPKSLPCQHSDYNKSSIAFSQSL